MHNLFKNCDIRRLKIDGTNYILAAGTTDVDSEAVDMLGYEGVAFVTAMGTLATGSAVTTQLQQSSDDAAADAYTDIAGSQNVASAVTDDDKFLITEIYRPKERYLRQQTIRGDGGNSTIDALFAILFRPGQLPVSLHSTVEAAVFLSNPGEGTA